MIEYVETIRNMSMKSIDATKEIDQEIMEKRIVKPNKLIMFIEHFIQQTKEVLKAFK